MPGLLRDSMQKIVEVYFSGITAQEFTYNGKVYKPKEIYVSPLLLRGTTCPPGCGGCCMRVELVYLPSEVLPDDPFLKPRHVTVNGVERELMSDPQTDHQEHYCRYLNRTNGRCDIHDTRPFAADFELIRFTHRPQRVYIATRLFGRGWSYKRITGQTKAICDVLPVSEHHKNEAIRKMLRLKDWSDYYGLQTHLPQIIDWMKAGPHDLPLLINPAKVSNKVTLLDRI